MAIIDNSCKQGFSIGAGITGGGIGGGTGSGFTKVGSDTSTPEPETTQQQPIVTEITYTGPIAPTAK